MDNGWSLYVCVVFMAPHTVRFKLICGLEGIEQKMFLPQNDHSLVYLLNINSSGAYRNYQRMNKPMNEKKMMENHLKSGHSL